MQALSEQECMRRRHRGCKHCGADAAMEAAFGVLGLAEMAVVCTSAVRSVYSQIVRVFVIVPLTHVAAQSLLPPRFASRSDRVWLSRPRLCRRLPSWKLQCSRQPPKALTARRFGSRAGSACQTTAAGAGNWKSTARPALAAGRPSGGVAQTHSASVRVPALGFHSAGARRAWTLLAELALGDSAMTARPWWQQQAPGGFQALQCTQFANPCHPSSHPQLARQQ